MAADGSLKFDTKIDTDGFRSGIKEILSKMKNIEIVEPIVTVKTKLSEETEKDLLKLIEVLKK